MAELRREETAIEDNYYSALWSTKSWGGHEPNDDERARAAVVTDLARLHFSRRQNFGGGSLGAAALVSGAPAGSHASIVDLGCGRGWLTNMLFLELKDYQITGLDPVAGAITRAKSLFPNLDFRVGGATQALTLLGLDSTDLVVASEVIEHVANAEKTPFLSAIYALLKQGGALILTTPRGEAWAGWQRWHRARQPIEDWIFEADLPELCQSHGFRVATKRRIFVPGTAHSWLSRVVTSRRFAQLMHISPNSQVFNRLRHHCAIYQALLCVK